MNKLDERWEPMPDYMKEEIEGGKGIIDGRSKSDNASISIRNMNGTLVWSRKLTKARDQLVADISALPSGVYSVSVQIGTNLLTTKNLIVAK